MRAAMQNIVLDTNIIVSAVLSPQGNPAKILNIIEADEDFQIYFSPEILIEYEEVLSQKRLNIVVETQNRICEAIKTIGILTYPSVSSMPLPDENDRVFYDTAKESGAILITGNMKHYPKENFIMTPAQFLSLIESR